MNCVSSSREWPDCVFTFWKNHLDGSEEEDFNGKKGMKEGAIAVVLATDAGGPYLGKRGR